MAGTDRGADRSAGRLLGAESAALQPAWRSPALRTLLGLVLLLSCMLPPLLPGLGGELWRRWIMIAAALWVVLLWGCRWRIDPVWLRRALFAYLGAQLLSLLLALHRWPGLLGGNERGLGLLSELAWWALVLVIAKHSQASDRLALLRWAALSALLLSLWALAEWACGQSGSRSTAGLGNPLLLASLLAVALPLQLWPRVWPGRRCALLVLAIQLLALLSSGGRAALLAVAAAGLLAIAIRLPPRRAAALLLAGVALLLAATWSLAQWRPASVAIRAELYAAAVQGAVAQQPLRSVDGEEDALAPWRPLIGYGPESVEPVLTRYRSERLNDHNHEHAGWDRWADRSHSRPLDRWIEGGLLGIGLAALVLVLIARRLWPLLRGSPGDPPAALAVGLLIWLLDGMVGVPSAAADLLAALLLGCAFAQVSTAAPSAPRDAAPALGSRAVGIAIALALGLLCTAAGMLWAHGRLAAASSAGSAAPSAPIALALRWQPYSALPALRALQASLIDGPPVTAECDQKCTLARLQRWATHVTAAAPSMPRGWLLAGQVSALAGDMEQAALAWSRGLSLLQDADMAFPLSHQQRLQMAVAVTRNGAQLSTRGAGTAAQQHYRFARRVLEGTEPPNSAAWWATLAWLRAQEGERQGAIDAYQHALRLNPEDAASRRNLQRLQGSSN